MESIANRLRAAAEIMRERGMCKEILASESGERCALGAFLDASGLAPSTDCFGNYGYPWIDLVPLLGDRQQINRIAEGIVGMPLHAYNNLPGTTVENVTALMELMADMLDGSKTLEEAVELVNA